MTDTTTASAQPARPTLHRLLSVLIGLALALATAEVVLRAAGRRAFKEVLYTLDVPLMHEPDAQLGWRNQEGQYLFGPTPPIRMTFWRDHTRATAFPPVETGSTALVIGDSFVQGWAVSDDETFAWLLQKKFPSLGFRNLGCAGYGTTQSLLALERYMTETNTVPKLVIYGFSDFHVARNVATAMWLKNLAELAYRGHVFVPYAIVGTGGKLELHAPVRYPSWPLDRQLAFVAALEEQYAELRAAGRTAQSVEATQALLVELDRVVRARGGTLVVALLSEFVRGGNLPYRFALEKNGIAIADCADRSVWADEMQVPGYGHPNAMVNGYWAACIARTLEPLVPGLVDVAAPGKS